MVAALKLETHNDPRVVWCWGRDEGIWCCVVVEVHTAAQVDEGEEDVSRGEAR